MNTQVSRGDLVLHLSEHHGDGTPGGVVYTELTGVRALHAELAAKDYPYLRPGPERDETGWSLTLIAPFGNRLRFTEPEPEPERAAAPDTAPEAGPESWPRPEAGPAPLRPPVTGTCG
ncbi:glyoxalase superfamily protein [Streptomyces sp. NPDC001657]|uniref:glyoxalase superfamily protein n=1 Tax=Streptomyces sp. NPDC001657 TaxID=3154522 RepID=UPI003326C615